MTALPQDEQWMQAALAMAECAAQRGEVPVGAVVVRDGLLLGEGYNQSVTTNDPTAHAEVVALRCAAQQAANYRLPGATLYVTVEPCTMCAGALVHARIERLVFGTIEPKAGAVVSTAAALENRALNHQVQVTQGVLAEAAGLQLKQFFAMRRAKRESMRSEPCRHD